MKLAPFKSSVSDRVHEDVLKELALIEAEFEVKILFAIESGSRGWGFPSPDSDYDVRFVYAHRPDWYLSIYPGRDVIERPISDELDIAGWDIRKAIGLMMKPNPVMYEWLSSPIRYIWRETECQKIQEFATDHYHRTALLHHHLNHGRSKLAELTQDGKSTVSLKKYFYTLRPALVIRWIRDNPELVPPMNVQELVQKLDLDPEFIQVLDELIQRKTQIAEIGEFEPVRVLDEFIEGAFSWAEQVDKQKPDSPDYALGDELFRALIRFK